MHYELVSRALAFVSCLSALSLFAMSMAIAAVNVGRTPHGPCSVSTCVATATTPVELTAVSEVDLVQAAAVSFVLRHD